jgi:formyltetrahydrofolate synthetase
MHSDLYIAQHALLRPIYEIAEQLNLTPNDLDIYGSPYIAKLWLDVLEKNKNCPNAIYIDVSAITPTPLGEGKSTTLIGLGEAMKHLNKRAIVFFG